LLVDDAELLAMNRLRRKLLDTAREPEVQTERLLDAMMRTPSNAELLKSNLAS
jgi:transcription termination factor Rho